MTVKDTAPTRHLSFSEDDASEEVLEPITIELRGETFTAVPEVSGAALLDFVKATHAGDSGGLLAFLEASFEDKEWARLDALLRAKGKKPVAIGTIRKIVHGLVEEYTSRNSPAS